jgi:hypothetical protein
MKEFLLYHRHSPNDCAATFAAWNGFRSRLRGTSTFATCSFGAHEIWWNVTAGDEREALSTLPKYISGRTVAIRVGLIEVP